MKELKPYQELSEWVPMSKAVDYALIDEYDDAQVMRQRYNNWILRGYHKLRLGLLRTPKKQVAKVSRLSTVAFPDDAGRINEVGYFDSCGEYTVLYQVELGTVRDEDEVCGCEKCGSDGICAANLYDVIEELLNFHGGIYTKRIVRSFEAPTKTYIEQTTEPVYIQATGLVEMQTTVRQLLSLPLLPCGCVKADPNTLDQLQKCGCTAWMAYRYGFLGCLDENFAIDEENRLIHVSEHISKVVIAYDATMPVRDGQVYVPAVALETLAAYGHYKRDQRKPNLAVSQKQYSYQIYKAERKEMRKALIPIKLSVIENALNLIPY